MALKILLATTVRWPSAGRLAGAFSASGCTVDAILPAAHPAADSRYFGHRYIYRPLAAAASLRRAIEASKCELIVPLDDRAATLLVKLHAGQNTSIAALIERSLGDVKCYSELMSRAGFIESARLAGIRAPRTITVAHEDTLESALASIGFPAVLKADGTWGGNGVVVVNNRSEAVAAFHRLNDAPPRLRSIARAIKRSDAHHLLDALHAKPRSVSVQQFIAGNPATTAMACWQGKVLAANHLEVLVSQGATGPATVLKRIEDADMDAAAARLTARFNLSGLLGLDYIKDQAGRVHLIEINPRAPQSAYLNFGASHDLAAPLARSAGARTGPPRPAIADNTVALFPLEWMRDPASPYLKSAYHDVPWDDPALIHAWLSSVRARPTVHKWQQFLAELPGAARLEPGQS